MCGIVGVASQNMTSARQALLGNLLYIDTLRGFDSTGIAAVTKNSTDMPQVYKRALAGPDFLCTRGYTSLVETQGKDIMCFIGHNRWATKGEVNNENAHPFQHGGVTMVHNGSLSTWRALAGGNQCAVDSEAVCMHLNNAADGFESVEDRSKAYAECVGDLDGAFALVWHDYITDVLYFVRNDERPMWIAPLIDAKGDKDGIVWASDAHYIFAAANAAKCKVGKAVELPVGKLVGYDLFNACEVVCEQAAQFMEKKQWTYGYHSTYGGYSQRSGQGISGNNSQGTGNSASGTYSHNQSGTQCSSTTAHAGKASSIASVATASACHGEKGGSGAPIPGDYVEVMFKQEHFAKYSDSSGHGFQIGVCIGQNYYYLVLVNDVTADNPLAGVYAMRITARGILKDDPEHDKISRACAFSLYYGRRRMIQDDKQKVYNPLGNNSLYVRDHTAQFVPQISLDMLLPAIKDGTDDEEFTDLYVGPGGAIITEDEAKKEISVGCGWCQSEITLDDLRNDTIQWIADHPVHEHCVKEYEDTLV